MRIIGLDLGNSTFKGVEMSDDKGNIVLRRFGVYENTSISFNAEDDHSRKEYIAALRHFISESGFSVSDVVVSLPEDQVFTRVIQVPNMSPAELETSIQFEAEQYIPIPMSEVNFAFQVLEKDPQDTSKMNVLLVAAKLTILNKYLDILKNAGLNPKGLEPGTLAIQRALFPSKEDTNAKIILNITRESTHIVIVQRGGVRFTRSVPIGGETFTKALQQSLKLDYKQASEYKKTYGMDPSQVEGHVYGVLKPLIDNIVGELNRAKIFYTSRNPGVNIDKVTISGGSALMPGLLVYLTSVLDLEVVLANPWHSIQLSSRISEHKEYLLNNAPIFVTPIGLALKVIKHNN